MSQSIAIVGAGLSGLAVSTFLLQQYSKYKIHVTLFDHRKIGEGTSGIATGLLHPFSGAHAKLNRWGREGVAATLRLIEISEKMVAQPILSPNRGIFRPAITHQQQEEFYTTSSKYPDEVEWRTDREMVKCLPSMVPYPSLWIKNGIVLDTKLYLEGLWKFCAMHGATFKQKMVQSLDQLKDFDKVIFAPGGEIIHCNQLPHLSISTIRGQLLEISSEETPFSIPYPVNSHVYFLKHPSNNSLILGATYEKNREIFTKNLAFATDKDQAISLLLPKGKQLFPILKPEWILDVKSGVRAATPNHLPLIFRWRPNHWIITGMGSKGLLYHALYAEQLTSEVMTSSSST